MAMNISLKRKRGRPRRDEPQELNNFDLALIEEFKKRPAFYDRNDSLYRNREYLEPQWLEMAENLGQTVGAIKERLVQLRNRYNLEKRRIESLQSQYPNESVTSPWHLYDSISFLGEHIKHRVVTSPVAIAAQPTVHSRFPRPIATKMLEDSSLSDSDVDVDNQNNEEYENGLSEHDENGLICNNIAPAAPQKISLPRNTSQPLKKSDGEQQRLSQSQEASSCTAAAVNDTWHLNSSNSNAIQHEFIIPNHYANMSTFSHTNHDKFHSFGQFITSSLIDMSEQNALYLVKKFTADVVQFLIDGQRGQAAAAAPCMPEQQQQQQNDTNNQFGG